MPRNYTRKQFSFSLISSMCFMFSLMTNWRAWLSIIVQLAIFKIMCGCLKIAHVRMWVLITTRFVYSYSYSIVACLLKQFFFVCGLCDNLLCVFLIRLDPFLTFCFKLEKDARSHISVGGTDLIVDVGERSTCQYDMAWTRCLCYFSRLYSNTAAEIHSNA